MNEFNKTEKLREYYKWVRNYPSRVNEIIKDVDLFIKSEISKNERLFLSFISLKNDCILQNELNLENIDNYKKDLLICLENELFLINEESPFKIFEIIGKIQYANNLLNIKDENLKNLYDSFLILYLKEMNYFTEKTILSPISYDRFHLSFCNNIAILFIPFYRDNFDPSFKMIPGKNIMESVAENELYRNIFYSVIYMFKTFKHNYYKMTWEDVIREGFRKYDFIYKK